MVDQYVGDWTASRCITYVSREEAQQSFLNTVSALRQLFKLVRQGLSYVARLQP